MVPPSHPRSLPSPRALFSLPLWASVAAAVAVPLNPSSAALTPSTPDITFAAVTVARTSQATSLATITAAANGTSTALADSDEAALARNSACESSMDSWGSLSWDMYTSLTRDPGTHTYSLSYEYSEEFTTIMRPVNYSGPVSTLCDGVPRATGSSIITSTSLLSTYTRTITQFPVITELHPEPTCTYDWRGCELEMKKGYQPLCASAAARFSNTKCIQPTGAACRLNADNVKVYYWPQSKDPSVLCAPVAGQTPMPTPAPSAPVTAVLDGHTFTSPSIYISFPNINGAPWCLPTHSNAVIGFPPESISHVTWDRATKSPQTVPMTWSDMDYPVPASAYRGMEDCVFSDGRSDGCKTIFDADYNPLIALPTQPALFTGLDPVYGNCSSIVWRKYVTDPPIPLTTADVMLPAPSSAEASPSSSAPTQQQDGHSTTTTREPAAPSQEPAAPLAPSTAVAGGPAPSATGGAAAADPGNDGAPAQDPAAAGSSSPADPTDPQGSSSSAGGSTSDPGSSSGGGNGNDNSNNAGTDPAAFLSAFMGFTADPTASPSATGADNANNGHSNPIPVVVIGTQTIVAQPAGGAATGGGGGGGNVVAVGGTQLAAGQSTTLDGGVPVVVGAGAVVVGGVTHALPTTTAAAAVASPPDNNSNIAASSGGAAYTEFVGALTTIGGTPLSLDSAGGLWAGPLSLTAGPTIALRVSAPGSGARTTALVHWQSDSAVVVVGSEVFPLTGSRAGVGAFVLSGLGGTPRTTKQTVVATLTQTVRAGSSGGGGASASATVSGSGSGSGAAKETGTGAASGSRSGGSSGSGAASASATDDGLGGGTDAPSLATGTAATTAAKSGAGGALVARLASSLFCVATTLMTLHFVWL